VFAATQLSADHEQEPSSADKYRSL